MKLTAKNETQLDTCLKLLYSKGLNNLPIDMATDENGKLYVNVIFSVDDDQFNSIKKTYEILIAK